jgi:hypothetical protein
VLSFGAQLLHRASRPVLSGYDAPRRSKLEDRDIGASHAGLDRDFVAVLERNSFVGPGADRARSNARGFEPTTF